MIRTDLHTHTSFCDGKNTPEEMAEAAFKRGLTCLGFSGHCYTAFDESYCMSLAGTEEYRRRVTALKDAYKGKLEILCGIEQDYWSDTPTDGYDYVIGSVHYLKHGKHYLPVDESPAILNDTAEKHFGGDMYALAECYYDTVSDVVRKTGADIIGHFDLITKFCEREPLFDTSHPRYIAAWQSAADRLLRTGKPFELNTGAMSRGYRTTPYPAPEIIDYLRAGGGKLILSSDSHSADTLLYGFEDYAALVSQDSRPDNAATE